jgi:hypothetical protein
VTLDPVFEIQENSTMSKNSTISKKNSNQSSRSGLAAPKKPRQGAGRASAQTRNGAQTRAGIQARNGATNRGPGRRTESFRSRHRVLTALVPLVLVVALVATMIVIKAASGHSGHSGQSSATTGSASTGAGGTGAAVDTALSSKVATALSSVSAATFATVGAPSGITLPNKVNGSSVSRDAQGKAIVTYIGAEYCPFCAAERWAMAVALSRFGTFSNLSGTHSSSSDVYPNTQTLSFYGSHYTSPYIDFQPVEETTNQQVGGGYATLQVPTAAQNALFSRYDVAPYASEPGSIPFVDIGNRYVISGASFSPAVLQGLTRDQIAADLNNPSSPVAQAIDGSANAITAALSSVTGNQPSAVSNSAVIAALAKKIGA